MPITHFPNGLSSFGVPLIGSGPVFTTGNVFFVDSGSGVDAPSEGTKERPFATVEYATSKCTANNGDFVIAMPGHTESVTDSTNGLDLNVAGVTYLGIGNGTDRPTFNPSGDGFVWATAANVHIINFSFVAASNGNAVSLYMESDGGRIAGCHFADGGTDLHSLIQINNTAAATNDVIIENCTFDCPDAANDHAILMGVGTGWIVRDNVFSGAFTEECIKVGNATTGAMTRCHVVRNTIFNAATEADACIATNANSDGIVAENLCVGGHATQGVVVAGGGAINNYYIVNDDGASGLLEPIAT